MPFQIIRHDITKLRADVIVNSANPKPMIGRGTDRAIYDAAGAENLLAARGEIGELAPGQAAATPAFRLCAKYIIHTVGPVWQGGGRGEREILRACYANTLALAAELKAESIVFPLISSGIYGFPKDEAFRIALSEIGAFLLTHEMQVTLAVIGQEEVVLSEQLVGAVDAYLDEHQVAELRMREYGLDRYLRERRPFHGTKLTEGFCAEESAAMNMRPADAAAVGSAAPLEQILRSPGDTFQQRLFKLIDASGMDDVTVYKRANIDRKLFSRIRCKADYKPTKKTAVAFAIALHLDLSVMLELLACAGFAFSPSDKFDLIIRYCVENGIYDIFEINAVLFRYGQPILGS